MRSVRTVPGAALTPSASPSVRWTTPSVMGNFLHRGWSRSGGCFDPASSVGAMSAPSSSQVGLPGQADSALRRGLTDDLRLAHLLADDADSITMNRFKALDLYVTSKPDLTPVTDADTAVEEALRRTLSRARPRDAVQGEELAVTGWGPRRWVIDPIDGTKNFIRGVPVWATLIALMINDEVVVGVVSAPALGRRWWASAGGGAYAGKSLMSGTPCHVSDIARIE